MDSSETLKRVIFVLDRKAGGWTCSPKHEAPKLDFLALLGIPLTSIAGSSYRVGISSKKQRSIERYMERCSQKTVSASFARKQKSGHDSPQHQQHLPLPVSLAAHGYSAFLAAATPLPRSHKARRTDRRLPGYQPETATR